MDLFEYMREQTKEQESPLASRLRPTTLEEVVGQEHIIGKGKLLYRAIKADKLSSIIFYGPPGTGKTTLAKVIANTTSAEFLQINATSAGKKDMEQVVKPEDLKNLNKFSMVSISAKNETGLDKLEHAIKDMFFNGEISFNEEIYITNVRHKTLLQEALDSLHMVKDGINQGMSEDFLTIDLMTAYEKLGMIIGEEVEDDLADRIFSKFCMGK